MLKAGVRVQSAGGGGKIPCRVCVGRVLPEDPDRKLQGSPFIVLFYYFFNLTREYCSIDLLDRVGGREGNRQTEENIEVREAH